MERSSGIKVMPAWTFLNGGERLKITAPKEIIANPASNTGTNLNLFFNILFLNDSFYQALSSASSYMEAV